MKQTVDAIITLPVKAIFKAVYLYFMFHKRKVMLTQWTIMVMGFRKPFGSGDDGNKRFEELNDTLRFFNF